MSSQILFLSQVLMKAFGMIVRIIRMYMSKEVKTLLIALNLVLLDFLKHDLTKFLWRCCFIRNYRQRLIMFGEFLGFWNSYSTSTSPELAVPCRVPIQFTSQQIAPIFKLRGKGESATGIIVFSGGTGPSVCCCCWEGLGGKTCKQVTS